LETLSNITQDEIEYARMTTLIKSEMDWRSRMADARREGREEGLEEGILITARNALEEGASVDFVQKITGLSFDAIERLKDQ